MVRLPVSLKSLRAAPYLAVELLQDRVAVLVALLVIAHHPKLFCGEAAKTTGDLLHSQLVIALDGELGGAQPFLGVREWDVEKLRDRAQHFLGHLLEGLLLLLGLLLERLPLLLGLLHPLLGRLLEGLLLLLGLRGEVGPRGVKELHVGVHHLLNHLLGVLLLRLDLLRQGLQHAEPLLPGLFRRSLRRALSPTVRVSVPHRLLLATLTFRNFVYPLRELRNPGGEET